MNQWAGTDGQARAAHAAAGPGAGTIGAALRAAGDLGLDRLDAQLLLAHCAARPRTWLLAHDGDVLDAATAAAYLALVRRRADGVPLAYLIGEKEFFALALRVTPDVLVPRPETELLVAWALEKLRGRAAPWVLDLGTGCGAVALALAHERPDAVVTATDASDAALAVARDNAHRLGLTVHWTAGSWWDALTGADRYDLVVSNPPYIADGDPHLPALRHEPRTALTPGGDGLGALREICAGAPRHLLPGGWLLLEHGHDQGAAVRALLLRAGLQAVTTRRDLAGHERCSGGRFGPPGAPGDEPDTGFAV